MMAENPNAGRMPGLKLIQEGKTAATIYDIAKLAGVNPSTVSRALSKPERVTSKTRKLVEAAADELNYQVNPVARALHTGRTSTLGLIVADITNPTFFDIIRGAKSAAIFNHYTLVLAESSESAGTEVTAARRVMPSVDGLILASPRMDDEAIQTLARDKPVVVINRKVEGVSCVIPDVEKGIRQAIRSLAANGHRKLAYICGPPMSWMSARRWEGVEAACDWSRMEPLRFESTEPTVEGGRLLARDIRDSGVTAVVAYNDLLAIGLMQELQAGGISVPDRLSIVGFDDIFGADFTSPPLTTIRSPLRESGALAAGLMLHLLNGGAEPSKILREETELILRGSSGRLLTN